MSHSRRFTSLVLATLLAGSGLALGATPASAAPQRGLGFETPAQPYKGNPDKTDWVGSYMVNGKQVWCVQFAFLAPDSDEQYQPGEALKTKWGTDLPGDVAADISYLLLRHATTDKPDVSAALGHILHSSTAAPQTPDQLAPTNDFRHIAYNVDFHFNALPPGAQAQVAALKQEAAANRGPWTAAIGKPQPPQVIGKAADWPITVHNRAGKDVPAGVEVTVTVTGGVLGDGKATGVVKTPGPGKPLAVSVTPTDTKVSVSVSLAGPAERPVVQQAVQLDTQRIVSTGGSMNVTSANETTAVTAPGIVKVAKTNAQTGAPVAGVSLRVTAGDKIAPAVDQNGKAIIGVDERPSIFVTGSDGTITIPNLQTPQQICVIEVAVPAGFEENFDADHPPSACGLLNPGATLALTVANRPNKPQVPVVIPAGDAPIGLVHGTVSSVLDPASLVLSLAGLLVILAGLGGLFVRRRAVGRR